MTNIRSTDATNTSLTRDFLHAAGYYLDKPRGMLVIAATVVAAGIALNWDWLVAVGLAPILIAVLPCAVMCALGLCMHKTAGGSGGCCADSFSPRTNPGNDAAPANSQPSHPSVSSAELGCCHEGGMSGTGESEKTRETERGSGV